MHSLGKSFCAAGSVLSGVLDYIGVSVNTLCQPLGSAAYLASSFLDALNTEATKLLNYLPLAKAMLAGLGIDRLFGIVRVLVGRVILGVPTPVGLGLGIVSISGRGFAKNILQELKDSVSISKSAQRFIYKSLLFLFIAYPPFEVYFIL